MAYAIDIIQPCFKKTKELFFPVKKGYWARMAIAGVLGGPSCGGGGSSGGGSSSGGEDMPDLTASSFRDMLAKFNSDALEFLNQYGYLVGIGLFVLYLLSLVFTYINSIFTFVFIDGLFAKDFRIRKSMSANKTAGRSLFFFRLFFGLIILGLLLIISSPLIYSFFAGTLSEFNFWFLIPMVLGILLVLMLLSVFMFFVEDFTIPLMYFRKMPFSTAFSHFISIAKRKKLEIFIYWLVKIGVCLVAGVAVLVILIALAIAGVILAIPGVILFFLLKTFSMAAALVLAIPYAIVLALLFIAALILLTTPVTAFFRLYSMEMTRSIDKKK